MSVPGTHEEIQGVENSFQVMGGMMIEIFF